MQGVGPGSVLGGRYAVTLRTSSSAHHERWRADDRTLERAVVLVCFAADASVAPAALDAARRAAGVEDPRLVRVLDVGTDHNVSFIVEEPLTGAATIAELLTSGGLPAAEVRRLVGESASALDKARQRGLHHLALTPDSVLRMPDGAVKVRGIATDAALGDAETFSGEQASRLDAIGLVKLVYAGLTARWPAGSADRSAPGQSAGEAPSWQALTPAPTIVGGVAPASEIVAAVPNDLDLICRMTLNDDRGPLSPGDLAVQIAPWTPSLTEHEHTAALVTEVTALPTPAPPGPPSATPSPTPSAGPASAPPVAATRRMPALGRGWRRGATASTSDATAPTGSAEASDLTRAVGSSESNGPSQTGDGAEVAAAVPTSSSTSDPEGASTSADSDPAEAPFNTDVAAASASSGATSANPASPAGRTAGMAAAGAAAGAAAAGAAGAFGDRVGSFARAAADKATVRAAERRAAHAAEANTANDFDLDDAFDDGPTARLEPAVPLLGRDTQEAPSKAASRVALAVIGVLVVVALVIGINNVMKIGQSDGPIAAGQTVTVTGKRTPTTTSSAPTTTTAKPTSAPPAEPISITGGTGFDPQDDNTEADQKVKLVFDGDTSTGWESRWYGTPNYNGTKDGVGVELNLDRSVAVKQVVLTLPAKQDVTVYAADTADLDGAQKIGSVTDEQGTIKLTAPKGIKKATKLLIWVTKAAPAEASNHYRAQISEVTVR